MRSLTKRLLRAEGCAEDTEVSILLTNDERIAELNRQYRETDGPTDVLSFSMTEGEVFNRADDEPALLGDVVISVETAGRQAAEQGRTLDEEIDLLLAHGLLHLLGYDHEQAEQERIMFAKQEEVLGQTKG
jgi:probable rRNA maturation factor